MKALQWYLHEDDLKAGDTGEAALIAAQKEEKIHLQNIQVGIPHFFGPYLGDTFSRKMRKKIEE